MLKTVFRWTWYGFLLALIALAASQFWFLAHIWYWADHNPESTAFMRSRLSIIRADEPGARLAAMLPSPRSYTPRSDTLYLQERTTDLLSHMHLARIP